MVHFIDFINYLIDDELIEISASQICKNNNKIKTVDDLSVTLKYGGGSIGNIVYSSIGSDSYPKEKVEIHTGSKSFSIDDFKVLYSYSNKSGKKRLWRQDKGHLNELIKVHEALSSNRELFDLNQLYLVHKIAFAIINEISN